MSRPKDNVIPDFCSVIPIIRLMMSSHWFFMRKMAGTGCSNVFMIETKKRVIRCWGRQADAELVSELSDKSYQFQCFVSHVVSTGMKMPSVSLAFQGANLVRICLTPSVSKVNES
jgi:hypothetical protein